MNIPYTRSELFDLDAARFVMVHWWIALFTGGLDGDRSTVSLAA